MVYVIWFLQGTDENNENLASNQTSRTGRNNRASKSPDDWNDDTNDFTGAREYLT